MPAMAHAGAAPAASGSDINVLGLVVASFLRHRKLILTCGLFGFLAALAFSQLAPPRYQANAALLVDPRDLLLMEREVTPTSSATDTGIAVVESQARVLNSDSVLKRAIETLKLEDDPEFNGTKRGVIGGLAAPIVAALRELVGSKPEPKDKSLITLQTLERQVWVTRPERTFIVELGVWSKDSKKAVAIANAIVKAYLDDQAAARAEPALSAGKAIGAGLDPLRKKLVESENKVSLYKTDNKLVGASGRLINEQQLTDANNLLAAARGELGRAKAKYDEAQRLRDGADVIPEAVASPALRQIRGQLANINSQKAKLSAQLRPQHPVMAAVMEQERELQGQVREELRRIVTSARIEYERDRSVEISLAASLESLRSELNTTNQSQIKLRELESELEANRSVYQAAIVRTREAREQARLNTTNVRVITEPAPARDKLFPPSPLLLLPAGLILGLGLGAFIGLLRDGVNWQSPAPARVPPRSTSSPVARTPRVVSAATPRPVTQPAVPDRPFDTIDLRGYSASRGGAGDDEGHQIVDLALSVLVTPRSGIGGQLNDLSSHLDKLRAGRGQLRKPHVVMVTSDESNPMKSTIALGLANAAYAESKRVLLIDADVDARRLSSAMGETRRNGTEEVMAGSAPLAAAIITRPGSTLEFLPVRDRVVPARCGIINPVSLRCLLRQAKQYDVVIVEAPVLDASSVAESFWSAADDVVLTMRVDDEGEAVVFDAMRRLRQAVPKFCNLVLTD